MIVCHTHKFILLKPMKTAGTSIQYFLSKFCEPTDVITPITPVEDSSFKPQNAYPVSKIYSHMPLYRIYKGFTYERLKDYRVICSTRNTWDRVASHYNMRKQRGKVRVSFERWITRSVNRRIPRHNNDFKGCSDLPHMLYTFASYRGQVTVTDWIHQESIEDDLLKVCDSLGLDTTGMEIPHAKKSDKKPYTEFYNDNTRDIIAKKYERDIKYFGYEYGS